MTQQQGLRQTICQILFRHGVEERDICFDSILQQVIEWVDTEIIGEDETSFTDHWGDYHNVTTDHMDSQNTLRASQRNKLSKLKEEEVV